MLMRTMLLGMSLVACLNGGCAALAPKATPQLTAQVAPGSADGEKSQGYIVEFRDADGRKVQAVEKPLTGQTHVQEALKESRALSKWNRAKLDLIRQLPQGGEHRMKMEYSLSNKRIDPENDYQLHPGDRIVVTEDTTTPFDELLQKLSPGGKSPFHSAKHSKYEFRN
jgi:hypothetical protein